MGVGRYRRGCHGAASIYAREADAAHEGCRNGEAEGTAHRCSRPMPSVISFAIPPFVLTSCPINEGEKYEDGDSIHSFKSLSLTSMVDDFVFSH